LHRPHMSEVGDRGVGLPDDACLAVLRHAFLARYGPDVGAEVHAEVVAWAWEHRERVQTAANPGGLLYRVGQSMSRRHRRWSRDRAWVTVEGAAEMSEFAGYAADLAAALGTLRHEERVAVILVHGFGYPYAEVARSLGVSTAAVTNHVHRGLQKLRGTFGGQA
jgi:DNA-directed RNA polymerase specialized sigma24 family protein